MRQTDLSGRPSARIPRRADAAAHAHAAIVLRDVSAALIAAHEAGIYHCDVRPENIVIDGDHAVLIDWGLATKKKNSNAGCALFSWFPGESGSAAVDFGMLVLTVAALCTGYSRSSSVPGWLFKQEDVVGRRDAALCALENLASTCSLPEESAALEQIMICLKVDRRWRGRIAKLRSPPAAPRKRGRGQRAKEPPSKRRARR